MQRSVRPQVSLDWLDWLSLSAVLFGGGAVLTACVRASVPSVCPTPVVYSAEMQARAADELDALPSDAALREMIADYIRERKQLRVGVR